MKKVLAMAAAVASMVVLAPSAQAAGPFTYKNVSAGLCLDVFEGIAARHTPVQLYRCTGGTPQKWYREASKYGDQLRTALRRTYCIETGSKGEQVQLWECDDTFYSQQWKRISHSDGSVSFRSRNDDTLCLDAADGRGPKVILWDCHYGPEQRWR